MLTLQTDGLKVVQPFVFGGRAAALRKVSCRCRAAGAWSQAGVIPSPEHGQSSESPERPSGKDRLAGAIPQGGDRPSRRPGGGGRSWEQGGHGCCRGRRVRRELWWDLRKVPVLLTEAPLFCRDLDADAFWISF